MGQGRVYFATPDKSPIRGVAENRVPIERSISDVVLSGIIIPGSISLGTPEYIAQCVVQATVNTPMSLEASCCGPKRSP